jgi:hypothetical protein
MERKEAFLALFPLTTLPVCSQLNNVANFYGNKSQCVSKKKEHFGWIQNLRMEFSKSRLELPMYMYLSLKYLSSTLVDSSFTCHYLHAGVFEGLIMYIENQIVLTM